VLSTCAFCSPLFFRILTYHGSEPNYLNLIAFALSGFLLYVYRRGLGAPGQYRDPICGMRTGDSEPSATYDGETYYFCSQTCKEALEEAPDEYATGHPMVMEGHGH